jgi:preprotein translocase subunit SecE
LKTKIINFFTDIVKEMKKVSWPKREELKDSTVVVLITSLLFAAFVFVIDKILSEGLKVIF